MVHWMSKGQDATARGPNNEDPMLEVIRLQNPASPYEQMEVLDFLLQKNELNVNMANILQESPLHLIHYDEEASSAIFRKIMTKSPDMLAANHRGQTPLHLFRR